MSLNVSGTALCQLNKENSDENDCDGYRDGFNINDGLGALF